LSGSLDLTPPLTGTSIPYSVYSVFKTSNRATDPNQTNLVDPWVSYNKDLTNNSQNINTNLSYQNINSNLLVNTEYDNITGASLDINILSLKNTNTPENYQTRNNPFYGQNQVETRDYKALFTGSHQLLGNDNITLGYQTYTTQILLKADQVTYFHTPPDMYPYTMLNIADAGLIEAGAIAGDHPLKSDKIFKKKADFKYTSPDGNPSDELDGSFLCSWLSGSYDVTVKPIWVDRYYNPQKMSYLAALTSTQLQPIIYNDVYQSVIDTTTTNYGQIFDVFDKPSDLTFEPGCYYAYHHYGPNAVNDYLNSLTNNLVQSGFPVFIYGNGGNAADPFTPQNEFYFDGTVYGYTPSLSSIANTNQFTVSFYMSNDDWTKPFAYQLLGNYSNNGFGIFNKNNVTPTLFIVNGNVLTITNTNFVTLNTVYFTSPIVSVIKREGFQDYHVVLSDGSIRRLNNVNVEIQKTSNTELNTVLDLDYTSTDAYLLTKTGTNTNALIDYNLNYCTAIDITTAQASLGTLYFPNQIGSINSATTVDYYNGNFYFTPGKKSYRVNDQLYFSYNNTILLWDSLGSNTQTITAFASQTTIDDFNFDFASNMWVLNNSNKFATFDSGRSLILSGTLPTSNYVNYKIDFVSEFTEGEYVTYPIITQRSPLSANAFLFYKLDPTTGNITLSSTYQTTSGTGFQLTNSDYLRKYIETKYPDPNLNVKTTLVNVFNNADVSTSEIIYSLSGLDPGYHHFAVRLDTYLGTQTLLIDGIQVGYVTFDPRKYKFSNLINSPFYIGASVYNANVPMFQYLKQPSYFAENIKIKNFNIYNTPLNYFDIFFLARQGMTIQDIKLDFACGRKNYLEEIERYFKFSVPGNKSSLFNLIIRNSGIGDATLQAALEQRILTQLNNSIPGYTQVNSIIWES